MNTTPTIFNIQSSWKGMLPSYTAVGGSGRAASTGLSAVLLNRGGRFPRRTLFEQLNKAGFDNILSIETNPERYDIEELSGCFPFIRFILLKEKITPGEMINMAAAELTCPYFFVLWNDYHLFNGISAAKMTDYFGGKRLCTVPAVQNSRFEILPTLSSPLFCQTSNRGTIRTLPEIPLKENQRSLFPHDWLGFYDKERFLRLGGFDREITHPYWQLMDFGFRSCLWDEEILSTQLIRLIHDGASSPLDNTTDDSYRLFYLKNLAPEWRGDHAYLPLRSFFPFLAKSGWDIPGAWMEFSHERKWVLKNQNRFCRDARSLIDRWERSGPEKTETSSSKEEALSPGAGK